MAKLPINLRTLSCEDGVRKLSVSTVLGLTFELAVSSDMPEKRVESLARTVARQRLKYPKVFNNKG